MDRSKAIARGAEQGGPAGFLLLSALLHAVFLLLPAAGAGIGQRAAPALPPAVVAAKHLPLMVQVIRPRHVQGPVPAPEQAAPAAVNRPVLRSVEMSELAAEQERLPGLLPEPDYYPASALTTPPGLHTLGATEPDGYERMEGGGRIVIELYLAASGAVDRWEMLEETAPPAFRDHVLKTFLAARYTPGMLLGRSVRSRLKVEATLAPA